MQRGSIVDAAICQSTADAHHWWVGPSDEPARTRTTAGNSIQQALSKHQPSITDSRPLRREERRGESSEERVVMREERWERRGER